MSNITICIDKILNFFDSNREASEHSNAIKTFLGEEFMFGLLKEYFKREQYTTCEIIDRKCTTGASHGPRLDGWVKAIKEPEEPIYYQVEVKMWSAHGVGSGAKFLPNNATEEEMHAYRKKLFGTYWSEGRFVDKSLNKVLTPMRSPESEPGTKVIPLACLWSSIHEDGFSDPFFILRPNPSESFKEVHVFSASSFLRKIRAEKTLNLPLPIFAERRRLLNTLLMMEQ